MGINDQEGGGIKRRDAMLMMAAAAAGLAGAVRAAPAARLLSKKIPSSGEMLPVIGIGTWQTFDVDAEVARRAALQEVMREFAALGGKMIDTSPMYGNAEEVAGDLIVKLGLRKQLFVATKVWTSGRAEGVAQMQESMRRLRAKPVDLMQVHNLVDVDTQLDTLRKWKKEGLVRYVGVTHYNSEGQQAIAALIEAQEIDFIQVNYSAIERGAERRLLPLAADKGVAVIANRPLAGGDVLRSLKDQPVPPWAAQIGCATWAQLMLKFVVSHPGITCAIPSTNRVGHLRDNMKAGTGVMPDQKMRTMIAAALAA